MHVPGGANQLMVSQKNCGVWNVEPSPQNDTFKLNKMENFVAVLHTSHSHVDIAIKNLLENLKLLGGSSAFSAKPHELRNGTHFITAERQKFLSANCLQVKPS
jgi:hypothetical protein